MKPYQEMLRDLVREQGDPADFRPADVRIDDTQLAIALQEYSDTLPEVAVEVRESVIDILRFKQNNSFVQMLLNRSHYEAIGLALVSGCRNRALELVRRDAELKASDMEQEDLTDAEYEAHV